MRVPYHKKNDLEYDRKGFPILDRKLENNDGVSNTFYTIYDGVIFKDERYPIRAFLSIVESYYDKSITKLKYITRKYISKDYTLTKEKLDNSKGLSQFNN
eukprot:Pgem_evm15s16871